tara:strand:- start:358 stop:591 length:234 start_codon:yes stop_codon:yes gene_type:complete
MYSQLNYYYQHRQYKLEYQKQYYQNNKQKIKKYYSDYYKNKKSDDTNETLKKKEKKTKPQEIPSLKIQRGEFILSFE